MKRFLWKFRCARRVRQLMALPWLRCWDIAGSQLESVRYDLTECPIEAAEYERDCWAADC
ncbi:MAG TPA: hypothetical protein VGF13_17170 [Verrucomicrobiae bacterium]